MRHFQVVRRLRRMHLHAIAAYIAVAATTVAIAAAAAAGFAGAVAAAAPVAADLHLEVDALSEQELLHRAWRPACPWRHAVRARRLQPRQVQARL